MVSAVSKKWLPWFQVSSVYSKLKYESGAHRVQRVPVTESQGRVHTSTATVLVMPEVEEVEYDIDPKDLRVDIYHASGAGGQNVNKVATAVRIVHLPTNIKVEMQEERTQQKNREKAMKIIRARVADHFVTKLLRMNKTLSVSLLSVLVTVQNGFVLTISHKIVSQITVSA